MRYREKSAIIEAVLVNEVKFNPAHLIENKSPFSGTPFNEWPLWLIGAIGESRIRPIVRIEEKFITWIVQRSINDSGYYNYAKPGEYITYDAKNDLFYVLLESELSMKYENF